MTPSHVKHLPFPRFRSSWCEDRCGWPSVRRAPNWNVNINGLSNPRGFTKATFTNPNNALFRKNPQNDHRCLSLIPQIWAILKWPGFTDPMNLTAISLLAVLCWGKLLLGPWFFAKNQVSVCPNLCPNLKSFSFKTKKSDTTRRHMWGLNSCLPMVRINSSTLGVYRAPWENDSPKVG